MTITMVEHKTRELIEGIHKALMEQERYEELVDFDTMYTQACEILHKQLLAKYKNIQIGESIQITFRVDIVTANGKVRGGSNADRNMPEYAEWRDAVYKRDGYACQDCGATGDINAHHIKHWRWYPELRFDVDNGKTVCKDCHAKYHPHLNFYK